MIIAGIISTFAFIESEERPQIGQRSQIVTAIRAHPWTRRACSRSSRTRGHRVAGLLAEVGDDRAVATSSGASSEPAAAAIATAMVRCCRVKCLLASSASR
jgi:hypothetical protein